VRKKTGTVLVEDPDGALGRSDIAALKHAGLGVIVCSGPSPGMGFDCPVVAGARCPKADQADVVLFARSRRSDRNLVLDALRQAYPDLPVVVQPARLSKAAGVGVGDEKRRV